ncbi:MAG: KH domain-containing protein [Clostridia bacterium]|nr:KH domain-containing protein [Clostridia bacterium]
MYELVDYIVGQLVDKEAYELVVVEDGDQIDIRVLVDKEEITKVIGKGGKIAKALRTIVRSAGQKLDKSYSVYVEER